MNRREFSLQLAGVAGAAALSSLGLSGLALAMALTGGDDADGCARNLLPSPIVDAQYLESLGSSLTWQEAEARAADCLARIAQDSN